MPFLHRVVPYDALMSRRSLSTSNQIVALFTLFGANLLFKTILNLKSE